MSRWRFRAHARNEPCARLSRLFPPRYGSASVHACDFVELSAFDEFHAEVAGAIALADLVNRHDARMVQARCRFGLEAEAFEVRFGGPLAESNDF